MLILTGASTSIYDHYVDDSFGRLDKAPLVLAAMVFVTVAFLPFWRLEVFIAPRRVWSTRARLAVLTGWIALLATVAWAFVHYGP